MAVTFTPNIGLAKPSESELAKNWAVSTQLADDNNVITEAKTEIPFTGYVPTLIATTTPPSIGAGSVTGKFQEVQGYIWGSFIVVFTDPGTSAGSGEYGISLPAVVDPAFHVVGSSLTTSVGDASVIGEGYAFDASTANTSGSYALDVVTISGTSYVRMLTEAHTTPAKTSRIFRDGQFFTIATGDSFSGTFVYKKL